MKRVCSVLVLLVVGSAASADDKPKVQDRNAREAMEGWVAAALAGKVDEADALADPGEKDLAGKKIVKLFKEVLGVASLKIPTVYVSDKEGLAIGVSEVVKFKKRPPGADGPNPDVVFFKFAKVKDKWLLRKIEFKPEAAAKKRVGSFRADDTNAQELPPKSKR